MDLSQLKNTFRSALKPSRFRVMIRKLWLRLGDKTNSVSHEENLRWLREHRSDFAEMAHQESPRLWEEAREWAEDMQRQADALLADAPPGIGGGGVYPFLYYLTRRLEPQVVVETGVAAGYSSAAFLAAIEKNGSGMLYSSDFPYFRLKDPEQYIGLLVDDHLRADWELYIDGDQVNLPKIVRRVERIDLFHYDSDKSYTGRELALSIISPKLASEAVVIIDDIQNNSFFYDYVQDGALGPWSIFEFKGKYLGVLWGSGKAMAKP